MSPDQHTQDIAKTAAREAVRETLMLLGIDASTPDGIQRAQRNYAFLDDLRVGTRALGFRAALTLVAALVTAVLAWVTLGMKHG